jgi:hypothetical protein
MTPSARTQPAYRASRSNLSNVGAGAWNFVVHLRLPFQLVLAPFMLWGAALAHASIGARFVVAFVVLHVCFYGGTTAYNSHYDRDEGPVGGLAHPPPAGPWLLPGSLALQGLGLAVAAAISGAFFVVCASFAILGVLYSHPSTRWKGNPWRSWLTVIIGQGALGTASGVAVASSLHVTPEIAWGVAGASMTAGAAYPLTQLFQVDEDEARGDRTVAIALGRNGTRWASGGLFVLGALFMAASARAAGRTSEAILLGLTALPLVAGVLWVCGSAEPPTIYRRISLFQRAAGLAFGSYAAFRMIAA